MPFAEDAGSEKRRRPYGSKSETMAKVLCRACVPLAVWALATAATIGFWHAPIFHPSPHVDHPVDHLNVARIVPFVQLLRLLCARACRGGRCRRSACPGKRDTGPEAPEQFQECASPYDVQCHVCSRFEPGGANGRAAKGGQTTARITPGHEASHPRS